MTTPNDNVMHVLNSLNYNVVCSNFYNSMRRQIKNFQGNASPFHNVLHLQVFNFFSLQVVKRIKNKGLCPQNGTKRKKASRRVKEKKKLLKKEMYDEYIS